MYANGSKIEYTESDNGFIQIKINPALYEQNVKINMKYTGTNEMIVASVISVASVMILVISEIKFKRCNFLPNKKQKFAKKDWQSHKKEIQWIYYNCSRKIASGKLLPKEEFYIRRAPALSGGFILGKLLP